MLNYLFYRLYRFFEITEKHLTPSGLRMPDYLASLAIALLLILNLITVDVIFNSIYGVHIVLSSILVTFTFSLLILLMVYFLFNRKKIYVTIVAKYETESPIKRGMSILFTLVYVVASFLLLMVVS
jgi:archaellum biogenesis protein FlaJ (TadC family)